MTNPLRAPRPTGARGRRSGAVTQLPGKRRPRQARNRRIPSPVAGSGPQRHAARCLPGAGAHLTRRLAFAARSGHLSRMQISLPSSAVPANLPSDIRLQIVSACARPPDGDGWLHEVKHDGHRLVAIIAGRGSLKLLSRNGHDRTPLFRTPFRSLAASGRPIVLDGEIAVPDERGVTHIDRLQDAFGKRGTDRLAYFAFDLLYLNGHDLRRCPIEERKALLRQVLDEAGSERVVSVDHIIGRGADLFERIREIGAEG